MIFAWILLSRAIALALCGLDMDENRLMKMLCGVEYLVKLCQAVTVDRAEIDKSHVLKHGALLKNIGFYGILDVLDTLLNAVSHQRYLFQTFFDSFLGLVVVFTASESCQIF